jgi:hypothetical protein
MHPSDLTHSAAKPRAERRVNGPHFFRRELARMLALALASIIAGVACNPHVSLQAPPATAAPEARLHAYSDLRPVYYQRTEVTTSTKSGNTVSQHTRTDFVELDDGTKVYHPEDLLVVLHHDSQAYEAIRAYEASATKNRYFYLGGSAALFAGLLMVVMNLNDDGSKPLLYTGGGLAIGGTVSFLYGQHQGNVASEKAAEAYESYDAGLRQRLNLCGENDAVVSCE